MRKNPSALQWYAILLIIAVVLGLSLPPDPSTLQLLHISAFEYRLVIVTLILPYAVIWFSAFYAYAKLRDYAKHMLATREGRAYKKIANGLGVLAFGLVVPSIIALVFAAFTAKHPGLKEARAIIDNYITLLVPLASFVLIGNGTRNLIDIAKLRPSLTGMRLLLASFILLGVAFTHIVLHDHLHSESPYYLPTYLIITTIVTPYLFAWFAGLMSAYELVMYSRYAKGLFYKRALTQLASGIILVIVGSIVAQYLSTIPPHTSTTSFATMLMVLYGLLIVQAGGFALIAFGAKRLKKIEEV